MKPIAPIMQYIKMNVLLRKNSIGPFSLKEPVAKDQNEQDQAENEYLSPIDVACFQLGKRPTIGIRLKCHPTVTAYCHRSKMP